MRPYIGVTGFMDAEEVKLALEIFEKEKGNLPHKLMVGVLASFKTLYGETNKWPNRYPKIRDVSKIFLNHPDALNLVHYSTDNTDLLFVQLMAITELIGPKSFHGFQLNIPWPNPKELIRYKAFYPYKKIVLQIGSGAFEAVKNLPEFLINRILCYRGYESTVDCILLDTSRGKGKLFDTELIKTYLQAVDEFFLSNLSMGVAGGLYGETAHILKPLFAKFPSLSIDAEGKLRDADDKLDMDLVEKYISNALKILRL